MTVLPARTSRRSGRRPVPAATRFRQKVDRRGPGQCWPWTGGTSNGYGSFRVSAGRTVSAHGFAKQLDTGEPCPPGQHPQHTCKTPISPLCCNPDHIIYVTPGATAVLRQGLDHPRGKLTDQQVHDIRRRGQNGERPTDLAREHNISAPYASQLILGLRRTNI
jgi:hypothetical protein